MLTTRRRRRRRQQQQQSSRLSRRAVEAEDNLLQKASLQPVARVARVARTRCVLDRT